MKRIVLAITLYISCMVVDYLVHYLNNRKKSSSPTTTQNSESYVVSCPASVKYVYMTIFALEIILFGGKSSNMGTGYEKSPHFAGIEKIL